MRQQRPKCQLVTELEERRQAYMNEERTVFVIFMREEVKKKRRMKG